MRPQQRAGRGMDDVARGRAFWADPGDDLRVIAVGDETDVLRIRLGCVAKACRLGQLAHLRLGHSAQREAQIIELGVGRPIQEVRLVARRIKGAVQLRALCPHHPADIVPRREAVCPQLARHAEQVGELRAHVAADTGHGGASSEIFVGKLFHHLFAEGAFMIEHVMRYPQPVGHGARIADVVRLRSTRPCGRLRRGNR